MLESSEARLNLVLAYFSQLAGTGALALVAFETDLLTLVMFMFMGLVYPIMWMAAYPFTFILSGFIGSLLVDQTKSLVQAMCSVALGVALVFVIYPAADRTLASWKYERMTQNDIPPATAWTGPSLIIEDWDNRDSGKSNRPYCNPLCQLLLVNEHTQQISVPRTKGFTTFQLDKSEGCKWNLGGAGSSWSVQAGEKGWCISRSDAEPSKTASTLLIRRDGSEKPNECGMIHKVDKLFEVSLLRGPDEIVSSRTSFEMRTLKFPLRYTYGEPDSETSWGDLALGGVEFDCDILRHNTPHAYDTALEVLGLGDLYLARSDDLWR